jgi:hypothetical protein
MMKSNTIVVYACPNPECENYYASSKMGPLEEIWNTDIKNEPTFPRSRCPDCGSNRERRYARLLNQDSVSDALRRVRQEAP